MKKVILLGTYFKPGYWEKPNEAQYPRLYTQLSDWEDLSKNCPLPALGIYIQYKEQPFIYLKIKGMRYDLTNENPFFDFEPIKVSGAIQKSSQTSEKLLEKLSDIGINLKGDLFSSIDFTQLESILRDLGEETPQEWKNLKDLVKKPLSGAVISENTF